MKRIAMGALALMLTAAMGTAHAANRDDFIRPETRIKGCMPDWLAEPHKCGTKGEEGKGAQ